MLTTDASPSVGDVIRNNPGANGAIVLAKHVDVHCSDQNDYLVACFLPDNNVTPFVIWTLMANQERYEVMWGSYCYDLSELSRVWSEKTGR